MDLRLLSVILVLHFVGDFILQSNQMAMNKSKSNKWLLIHIGCYSLALLPFGPVYLLANAVAHFCTDWVTSRITSALWVKGERHWFFVVIGVDQLIHVLFLVWTVSLVWRFPW